MWGTNAGNRGKMRLLCWFKINLYLSPTESQEQNIKWNFTKANVISLHLLLVTRPDQLVTIPQSRRQDKTEVPQTLQTDSNCTRAKGMQFLRGFQACSIGVSSSTATSSNSGCCINSPINSSTCSGNYINIKGARKLELHLPHILHWTSNAEASNGQLERVVKTWTCKQAFVKLKTQLKADAVNVSAFGSSDHWQERGWILSVLIDFDALCFLQGIC